MTPELPPFIAEKRMLQRLRHFLPSSLRQAVICLIILASGSLHAAEWTSLEVGHKGITKVSCWTAITAVASGLPKSTEVSLQCNFSDARGDQFHQTVATAQTDANGTITLRGYFLVGRQEGIGEVSIIQADNAARLIRQTIAYSESKSPEDRPQVADHLLVHRLDVPFLMTYGELAGIPELLRNAEQFSNKQKLLEGLTLPTIADLPEDSKGLDGVSMLLLADTFDCNKRQAEVIHQWVLSGGHLFVSAGGQVESLMSNNSLNWLTSLLQVQQKPFFVRDLSSLQSYVAAADPGVTALRTRRAREGIQMAGFGSPATKVDVPSLNGPILGRQSLGGGVVQFLAVDVNQKPLSEWNSLPQFYEVLLLGGKFSAATTEQSRSARISQSGVSDLGSQLMATVDSRADTSQFSTWAVMGMVGIYLLLIGPLDYFLVTYVFKRPALTWISFPCWVAVGVGLLFALTSGAEEFRSNHLNIIDVMPHETGNSVKVRSWISLRPKQTMKANLSAKLDDSISTAFSAPVNLQWAGRPEDVFGGMYRVGGVGLGQRNYQSDARQPQSLQAVPMLIDGSRELFVEAFSNSDRQLVESKLSVSGFGLLSGEFTSELPFDLKDWMIVFENRVYRPRADSNEATITSGSTLKANSETLYASDLKSFLNASRLVLGQTQGSGTMRGATQVTTPYDKTSKDPMYILTMASFYQTSGGSKYVGMGNSLLKSLEASDSIQLNHAVLIGKGDVQATAIDIEGLSAPIQDSETFVRLFLPVTRKVDAGMAPTNKD